MYLKLTPLSIRIDIGKNKKQNYIFNDQTNSMKI